MLQSSPLSPHNPACLTDFQAARLRLIEDYDLWFVIERVIKEGKVSRDQVPHAVIEFKKYIALIALGHTDLGMLSPEVDEVWHSFILFTKEYSEFCMRTCGRMIHHRPNTSRRPELPRDAISNFKKAYNAIFGPLSPIWQKEVRPNALTPAECDEDGGSGEGGGCDAGDNQNDCDSTAVFATLKGNSQDCDGTQAPCSAFASDEVTDESSVLNLTAFLADCDTPQAPCSAIVSDGRVDRSDLLNLTPSRADCDTTHGGPKAQISAGECDTSGMNDYY